MNKNIFILLVCLLTAFPSLADGKERFCVDGYSYMCGLNPNSYSPSFRTKLVKITMGCLAGRGPVGGSFEIEDVDYHDAYTAKDKSPTIGTIEISPNCSGKVVFDNGTEVASKKDFCIALCSDLILPTTDFGNSFWQCLNDCENHAIGISKLEGDTNE